MDGMLRTAATADGVWAATDATGAGGSSGIGQCRLRLPIGRRFLGQFAPQLQGTALTARLLGNRGSNTVDYCLDVLDVLDQTRCRTAHPGRHVQDVHGLRHCNPGQADPLVGVNPIAGVSAEPSMFQGRHGARRSRPKTALVPGGRLSASHQVFQAPTACPP